MHNKITIVDENDRVIGAEHFFDAIEKGCIRRASCIFIQDEKGNHLIQKRSRHISKPLLLDKAVGGHVDEGDTYLSTVHKEAQEELGLTNLELEEIVTSYRTGEFFIAVYKAVIMSNIEIIFDPQEVDSIYWMTTEEIDIHIKNAPEDFTENFIELWTTLRDKITS